MDLAGGIKSGASSLADGASRARSNPNGKPQNKIKAMLKTTLLTITGKIINLHDRHNPLFSLKCPKFCFFRIKNRAVIKTEQVGPSRCDARWKDELHESPNDCADL